MSPSTLSKPNLGLILLSLTTASTAQVAGQSLGLTGTTGSGAVGAPAPGAQAAQASVIQALSSIESSVAASAQTQVPLFLLNTDPQPIVASVIAAPNAQTTTFAIGCATGIPQGICGLPPSPSMQVEHVSGSIVRASVTVTQGDAFSLSWACTLTTAGAGPAAIPSAVQGYGNPSANAAVCTTSVGGGAQPPPTPTGTITLQGTDVAAAFLRVAVTAGSEKLAATASGSANGAAGSATTAASTSATATTSMAAGMTGMTGTSTAKANSTAGGTSGAEKIVGSGLGLSLFSAVFLGSSLFAL